MTVRCILAAFLAATAIIPVSEGQDLPAQTLAQEGSTPVFAQVIDWLDPTHFAVGRWDGSVSVFRLQGEKQKVPVITQSMALPSGAGVEMLTAFDASTMVTSDGRNALAVWSRPSATPGDPGKGFALSQSLPVDAAYGPANSGTALDIAGSRYLITGHENGYVLTWLADNSGHLKLAKAIDVHSPNHPSNPWGIKNVRGLAIWRDRVLITGAEDGDLVGLEMPSGKEVFRTRYNASAERGINAISVAGDWLLVANCSVGPKDKNLWLFSLSSGHPVISDSGNLAIDTFRSQTFDFDVDLFASAKGPLFFSSTEEGLIWMGRIDAGQLIVTGITKSSPEGGSVMDVGPSGDFIAAATYALRLYKLPK